MLKYFLLFNINFLVFYPVLANKKIWLPKDVRIGYDISGPISTLWQKNHSINEGKFSLYFGKIILSLEGGFQKINYDDTKKGIYKNVGKYFRFGVDYNFLKDSTHHHTCTLGICYAISFFEEQVQALIQDEYALLKKIRIWEDKNVILKQTSSAHWLEAVAGVSVHIWKNIFIGLKAKIKFNKKVQGEKDMLCFEIPGWGFRDLKAYGGIHYYVIYTFRIQKYET